MKYKVRISADNKKHLYTCTVEAEYQKEAVKKAMIEANLNKIILPEEFWCSTEKI